MSSTFTLRLSKPPQWGCLIWSSVRNLGFALLYLLTHLIADAIYHLGSVNRVKYLLDKIITGAMVLEGVTGVFFMETCGLTPMEIVLKGVHLYAVGAPYPGSASGSWPRPSTTTSSSSSQAAPAMRLLLVPTGSFALTCNKNWRDFCCHTSGTSCPMLGTHLWGETAHLPHCLPEISWWPLPLYLWNLDLGLVKILILSIVAAWAVPLLALCLLRSLTVLMLFGILKEVILDLSLCFLLPYPLNLHFWINALILWYSWSDVLCSPFLMLLSSSLM